ncbi:MAG: hypothetical protein JSV70_05930 [bacterium]|nr:MAG: hypothetical protein JSV70_05930 [bacterium]
MGLWGKTDRAEGPGLTIMNLFFKNFFAILLVVFLLVALGQWNHPAFLQKAYDQGKEMVHMDLNERGEKPASFMVPESLSTDPIHAEVVTEDGTRYYYDISIANHILIQLSALNLVISPKVEIAGFIKSNP